jgi:competence ComEA-like helix-hairpin-helix protein
MNWQEFSKEYLHFTRKERIGIIVLSVLAVVFFALPSVLRRSFSSGYIAPDTAWLNAATNLQIRDTFFTQTAEPTPEDDPAPAFLFDKPMYRTKENPPSKSELFYFDPNTIGASGWEKLGLRKKVIQTILRYREKGGYFRKPEDLRKIYGLRPEEYTRLAPFIQILPAAMNPVETNSTSKRSEKPVTKYDLPHRFPVDINTADTTAFISLPGIGSRLAGRITSFREKLGGFYSVEQLKEIYGLADTTFQKIKPLVKLENPTLRKININTASLEELKAHPYIRYPLAQPIIAYRNEHGPFSRPEDLRKVMAVTEEFFRKISPYITVE